MLEYGQNPNPNPHYRLRRNGRFLVAELGGPHLVLSTSSVTGGQSRNVKYLVNHQSCEAVGHMARHDRITAGGQSGYHAAVCTEIGLPAEETALLGTAANMNYAAIVSYADLALEVTAIVTAGVQGNAACAGDPAAWRESEGNWQKVDGTINTLLLINRPLTEAALARAAMTMTEAKTAALHRLAVPSLYSQSLATGTGTDQFAIASAETGAHPLTSSGPHVKLGELIGRTVRDATLEALRWQNGLEPSYTRGIFNALGRFGLKEETFFESMGPLLSEADLLLMRKNSKSVFYEPLVSAAAYAFAVVLDRVRYQTLPDSVQQEALRQQAASTAASLAAKPELWPEFHTQLPDTEPLSLFLHALALGWAEKWRT